MPRTREVRKDEAHDRAKRYYELLFGDRDPVDEPGTATGTPGDWWTTTALVPDLFDHIADGFAFYRNPNRALDPKLRELAQTRTGWVRESQFVYSQHVKASRSVGLSDEKIEAVRAWGVADCYSPVERAVLAFTDAICLQGGRVPDEIVDALRAGGLGDVELLELTYVVCTYNMHAIISRTLRLEYDDVDDRIVEVPAPSGDRGLTISSQDAMAVVDDETGGSDEEE
ncbi:MAG: carboxymuconolactone decarboxylase family protein [Actinomycetota bacterium]